MKGKKKNSLFCSMQTNPIFPNLSASIHEGFSSRESGELDRQQVSDGLGAVGQGSSERGALQRCFYCTKAAAEQNTINGGQQACN